ncbi:MAG TPA: metalloregulator ArsR/SmtB family transcription factor [Methylomirabilota bacterium]|nr:metalloregulator ArsR/SmtB family transcription factor [Methylomirabilota bacterium]
MGRQTDARLFQMQAEIAKVLANPTRLQILNRIGRGEVSYATLLRELGVSKTNLSQHLAILRKGGIITVRREGIPVYCRLTFPEIKDLCSAMRSILAKHLRESGRQGRLLMRRVV